MMRFFFLFLAGCLSFSVYGQNPSSFSSHDLRLIIDANHKEITQDEAMNLISEKSFLLTPPYLLTSFKKQALYKDYVSAFLKSDNSAQRLVGYFFVAAAQDSAYEETLLDRLKTEKDTNNITWAAMGLMCLQTVHTSALFDFLVKYEDFKNPHYISLYSILNKDSLRQTSFKNINSPNKNAKILAVQMLSKTGLDPETEKVVRQAVKDWDYTTKGYALYTLQDLQIGNVLELVKPILEDKQSDAQSRTLALQALANSPTKEDRKYVNRLADDADPISAELLDCFIYSKKLENVKKGIQFLYTKKIPATYTLYIANQPMLTDDVMLKDVQEALKKITVTSVLSSLMMALKGRKDEASVAVMLYLVNNRDAGVKQRAAYLMKGFTSPQVAKALPGLVQASDTNAVYLADVAIANNVVNLQPVYEALYGRTTVPQWKTIAVKYLSAFPMFSDRALFRGILESRMGAYQKVGDHEVTVNSQIRQLSALGLGKLKDESAVEVIIAEMTRVSQINDGNAHDFILALSMIKTEKSKMAISRFADSQDPAIKKQVADILKQW